MWKTHNEKWNDFRKMKRLPKTNITPKTAAMIRYTHVSKCIHMIRNFCAMDTMRRWLQKVSNVAATTTTEPLEVARSKSFFVLIFFLCRYRTHTGKNWRKCEYLLWYDGKVENDAKPLETSGIHFCYFYLVLHFYLTRFSINLEYAIMIFIIILHVSLQRRFEASCVLVLLFIWWWRRRQYHSTQLIY